MGASREANGRMEERVWQSIVGSDSWQPGVGTLQDTADGGKRERE